MDLIFILNMLQVKKVCFHTVPQAAVYSDDPLLKAEIVKGGADNDFRQNESYSY